MRKFVELALCLASLTFVAVSQPVTAPSFLEFSTFFQLRPDFRNTAPLTAPGPANDFYVAGSLGGSVPDLAAFPHPPVNELPQNAFRAIRYIAHFSHSGELLEWRLIWHPQASDTSSPMMLAVNRAGAVVLVFRGSSIPEPLTPDPFLAAGSASMLVLARDLREVRVSTFIVPQNVSIADATLDTNDNLVFSGWGFPAVPETAGVQWNSSFLARLSADGRQLLAFKSLQSLGEATAQRLAIGGDGGVWLATSTAYAGYRVTGPLVRPVSGTNLATWAPETMEWAPSLEADMSGFEIKVLGHADRPGTFLSSSGPNLYRSTDWGGSWSAVARIPGQGIVWSLSDAARLYAWGAGAIATSTDAGTTWRELPLPDKTRSLTIEQLAVSPSDPLRLAFRSAISIFTSSDGGQTWSELHDLTPFGRYSHMAIEAGDAGRLLLFDERAGILAYDKGTWVVVAESLNSAPLASVTYHPAAPPVISASQSDGSVLISRDGAKSWSRLDLCNIDAGPCSLSINPGRPTEWWVTGKEAWRSTDGGETWSEVPRPVTGDRILSVAFSSREESAVLVSTHVSNDIYLRKLDADWQLEAATYWGGSLDEEAVALLPDADGAVTLIANSYSRDYPTSSDALEAGRPAGRGLGITRFSSSLDSVRYSTTWGGSFAEDTFRARLLPDGVLWCGSTYTADLPALVEPPAPRMPGTRSAFVSGYDFGKNEWLPAYVFGGEYTVASDCTPLPDGRWVTTGLTDDSSFPRVQSQLPSEGSGRRPFLSIIRR